MCIICVKLANHPMPDGNLIKTMFENNPDGAGFMYCEPMSSINNNGYSLICHMGVHIEKGFMTAESLINRFKEMTDLDSKHVVIHFRIGTHGNKDEGTTHPFPVECDHDRLRETNLVCKVGLAHNGIISSCTMNKKGSIFSDTQIFIKQFLSCVDLNSGFTPKKMKVISELGGFGNKFALLNKFGEVAIVGQFHTDAEYPGLFFSNTSYLPPKPIEVTYHNARRGKNGKKGLYEYEPWEELIPCDAEEFDAYDYDYWVNRARRYKGIPDEIDEETTQRDLLESMVIQELAKRNAEGEQNVSP